MKKTGVSATIVALAVMGGAQAAVQDESATGFQIATNSEGGSKGANNASTKTPSQKGGCATADKHYAPTKMPRQKGGCAVPPARR